MELKLPLGFSAEPAVLEGVLEGEARQKFPTKITIDRKTASPDLQIIPFDITLDGKRHGELFDFIVRASE